MNLQAELTRLNERLNDFYVEHNTEDIVTYPKLVTLTTTLRCNYRCWMCYQKTYEGDMDWRIVEALAHVLPFVKTLQLFGGEPLLYPRVNDLFSLASDNACEIQVITNGSLLTRKNRELILANNVSQVKVSLEAATQPTYSAIRGGDLDAVFGNIAELAAARNQRGTAAPEIQINFVAMERNIRELPGVVERAAATGVNSLLVLYMNCGSREDLARESLYLHQDLSDEYMQKALEAGERLGLHVVTPGFFDASRPDPELDRTCHSPWKNCLVDIDGTVSFCCGGAGPIGNLLQTPFDELWHGEKIGTFRRLVNKPGQPACCRTCRVKGRNHREASFHIRDAAMVKRLTGAAA